MSAILFSKPSSVTKAAVRLARVIAVGAFVVAIFCGAAPSAADVLLGLPEEAQEHSEWCWAGSSQPILEYYGSVQAQCTLVNWAFQQSGCCGNTTFAWTNTSCNYWNYMWGAAAVGSNADGGLQGILAHWGVNSTARGYALTWGTSVAEINAGRPFVMRFGWTGGGGHFLVGYGYDSAGSTYLDYMDPWPGNGYTKSTYAWTASATDHTWTHTLQITTPHSALPSWRSGESTGASGWRYTSWLGWYNVNSAPWYYHAQHGWLYSFDGGGGAVTFWDNSLGGFCWTSSASYPVFYWYGVNTGWYYYLRDSSNPRWFYRYNGGVWVTD